MTSKNNPAIISPKLAINQSWQRCQKEFNLSRESKRPIMRVQDSENLARRSHFFDFLDNDMSEFEWLAKIAMRANQCVVIADSDSIILSKYSSSNFDNDLKSAGISCGSSWTERSTATNGVSMALQQNKTVTLRGEDHYFTSLSGFTCTATPLIDHKNNTFGVLDLSGFDDHNPRSYIFAQYLISLVSARVQARLFKKHYRGPDVMQLELSNTNNHDDENVNSLCAINSDGAIVGLTNSASMLLGESDSSHLIGQPIEKILDTSVDDLASSVGSQIERKTTKNDDCFIKPNIVKKDQNKSLKISSFPKSQKTHKLTIKDIGGSDSKTIAAIDMAREFYQNGVPIFLSGESGVGKSALAEALHNESSTGSSNFIAIDCAAVGIGPDDLGHELNAIRSRHKLNLADIDTLFFKNVEHLEKKQQFFIASFLKDLRNSTGMTKLGSTVPLKIISSCRENIDSNLEDCNLSPELLNQINGAWIPVYPLRCRSDLESLISSCCAQINETTISINDDVIDILKNHYWQGNFWELQNTLRYASIYSNGQTILKANLPNNFQKNSQSRITEEFQGQLEQVMPTLTADDAKINTGGDRKVLEEMLISTKWNVTKAARRLGISRATLNRRIKDYDLARP